MFLGKFYNLIFREGYLRMSSFAYQTENLQNEYIHLTNNAV